MLGGRNDVFNVLVYKVSEPHLIFMAYESDSQSHLILLAPRQYACAHP
jgi:hypothetical protein